MKSEDVNSTQETFINSNQYFHEDVIESIFINSA